MPNEGHSLRAKLGHLWTQLQYLPRALHLVWVPARGWTLAWFVLLVVLGVLPAGTVYLSRALVDSLVAALASDLSWESIQPTVVLAIGMGGLMVLAQVAQSIMEWVRAAQSDIIGDYLAGLVHEQATTIDLAFYDSPEYHDRLDQARNDLQTRPLVLLENGGGLLQSGITLAAMVAILLPYGIWLPIVLLLSTLPGFYVVVRYNRRYHKWWEQTTEDRRWARYYDMLLTAPSIAGELRLFGLGDHFRGAYQRLRRKLRIERLQLMRKRRQTQAGTSLVAIVLSGAALVWMAQRAFIGRLTLGDLALFYQALNRGQGLLRSLLSSAGSIYENVLFLGNLFEYLDLEPQITDPPHPEPVPVALHEGIRFNNVSFSYPGVERAVLQDFSFEIPAGKVVAIVGANGAGKTTLVKLLCRFYDPQSGSIELDGTDLRDLPVEQLYRLFTVLFQFPAPYFVPVQDNIKLGDLAADPGLDAIQAAADSAGAHEFIMRLPQRYDTLLGKLFAGGVELSGGEWQRLALARAFLRRAQIMILDEPTSFMDSWAEVDWFDRFRELAAGRTAIFITHRFLLAKRADIIHVMDQGRIVESGSHDELLALGGRYAQSWAAQMRAGAQPSASKLDEPIPAFQPSPEELFSLSHDDGSGE